MLTPLLKMWNSCGLEQKRDCNGVMLEDYYQKIRMEKRRYCQRNLLVILDATMPFAYVSIAIV